MLGMFLFSSQFFHSLDFAVALLRGEVSTLAPVSHSVKFPCFLDAGPIFLLSDLPSTIVRHLPQDGNERGTGMKR